MTDERSQLAYMGNSTIGQSAVRSLPIIQPPSIHTSAPSPGDPMEVGETTPPASALMGPPSRTSPDEANGHHEHTGSGDQLAPGSMAGPNAAAAAAAGSQQPKVVQTAFIHKLYK